MNKVWIGLVEVIPYGRKSPLSQGATGAFVSALALASNDSDFRAAVEGALSQLNLEATQFEAVENFCQRLNRESVSEEFYSLAITASETGRVAFSSFHNYFGED